MLGSNLNDVSDLQEVTVLERLSAPSQQDNASAEHSPSAEKKQGQPAVQFNRD